MNIWSALCYMKQIAQKWLEKGECDFATALRVAKSIQLHQRKHV